MSAESQILYSTPYDGSLEKIDFLCSNTSEISIDDVGKIIKSNKSLCWKSLISECHIFLNISHPNILKADQIHFYKNDENDIKIEYVMTQCLPFDLNLMPTWSRSKIVNICYQIIDALAFLQENGIYHGDIKHDNILLDDNDNPILADFGLMFYDFNENACYNTQSYIDDGKFDFLNRANTSYDKLATSMFCLGILLFYIAIPGDVAPNIDEESIVRHIVNNTDLFVNKWIETTDEVSHLVDVIKKLLGPIAGRPRTYAELLPADFIRNVGTVKQSDFQKETSSIINIDRGDFSTALSNFYKIVGNCRNNLVTFELATEIFIKYYDEFSSNFCNTHSLQDYIIICAFIAQCVFSEKSVLFVDPKSYDLIMSVLRLSNFNFTMTLRTLQWKERASFCWYFSLVYSPLWRGDLLENVETYCKNIDIPMEPTETTNLPDWVSKFMGFGMPLISPFMLIYLTDMSASVMINFNENESC